MIEFYENLFWRYTELAENATRAGSLDLQFRYLQTAANTALILNEMRNKKVDDKDELIEKLKNQAQQNHEEFETFKRILAMKDETIMLLKKQLRELTRE